MKLKINSYHIIMPISSSLVAQTVVIMTTFKFASWQLSVWIRVYTCTNFSIFLKMKYPLFHTFDKFMSIWNWTFKTTPYWSNILSMTHRVITLNNCCIVQLTSQEKHDSCSPTLNLTSRKCSYNMQGSKQIKSAACGKTSWGNCLEVTNIPTDIPGKL